VGEEETGDGCGDHSFFNMIIIMQCAATPPASKNQWQ
jgi:hypothetical protein